MKESNHYIKCLFCKWKTKAWTTDMKGKKLHGYYRLLHHVEMIHNAEYKKTMDGFYGETIGQYE